MLNQSWLRTLIEGPGANQSMSNFGLFFIFAQICLIFGMSATNNILLIGKHFSVFFFCWFSLRFREITYAKTVKFRSGFLCCSFVEGETKEAFCFDKEPFCLSNVFCIYYFLKTKRKPTEKKNTEKCFPIHL